MGGNFNGFAIGVFIDEILGAIKAMVCYIHVFISWWLLILRHHYVLKYYLSMLS